MQKVNICNKFLQLVGLTARCYVCMASLSEVRFLCEACYTALPWMEHTCCYCGIPLPAAGLCCPPCQKNKPNLDSVAISFSYQPPVDWLIQRFKSQGDLTVLPFLGHCLVETLQASCSDMPDCLIFVPASRRAMWRRGFNQSFLLADYVSRCLSIPLQKSVFASEGSQAQKYLSKNARLRNATCQFRLIHPPQYKHVLLVDDIVTTGATTKQLANLLLAAGVERVQVLALARVVLNSSING